MFTYDMSKAGANSLYHYLYQCIKKDIVGGKVLAEEQLPSKRNLAQNLGISVVTVENAYAQLLAEGFIYSLPKKGFFVADINAAANAQTPRSSKKSRTRVGSVRAFPMNQNISIRNISLTSQVMVPTSRRFPLQLGQKSLGRSFAKGKMICCKFLREWAR